MKRLITICMMASISLAMFAQATSLTVDNQTPGWLSSKINYGDQTTVRNLKVTGYINATDLKFIGTLIQNRNLDGRLDLSEVNVVGETTSDKDNEMKSNAFNVTKNDTINYLLLPISLNSISNCLGRNLYADTLFYDNINSKMNYVNSTFFSSGSVINLILGERIDSIPKQAFSSMLGIKSVQFSRKTRYIGGWAFSSRSTLKTINLNDLDELEFLGEQAFKNDSSLYVIDTLIIPKKLKTFYPNSISYRNINHIYFSNTIEKIDGGSFSYTTRNRNYPVLHMESTTPPTFSGYMEKNNIVYVPKGSGTAYKNHNYWGKATIIEENPLEKVTLDKHEIAIDKGQKYIFTPTLTPSDADDKTLLWSVKDENVATVEQNGTITGQSPGKTFVYATSVATGVKDSCEVTVIQHVTGITMSESAVTFTNIGETKQLSVAIQPADATDKSVKWTSANPSICSVTNSGFLIALSNGTTSVIATTIDGSIPAVCIVTVDTTLSGIDEAIVSEEKVFDVYSVSGVLMRKDVSTLEGLPRGIYIVNGRKVVVK